MPPGVHFQGLTLPGQFFKRTDYIGNIINTTGGKEATGLAYHVRTTRKLVREDENWPVQRAHSKDLPYHKELNINRKWLKH